MTIAFSDRNFLIYFISYKPKKALLQALPMSVVIVIDETEIHTVESLKHLSTKKQAEQMKMKIVKQQLKESIKR